MDDASRRASLRPVVEQVDKDSSKGGAGTCVVSDAQRSAEEPVERLLSHIMTVMPQSEILVACCGPSILGWDPGSAPTPRRCLELQHKGQARAFGWLNAKALASAGDECVVNIFGVRDSKMIATVPKPSELPPDCSPATSVAVVSRDTVVCGHEGGAVVSYRLMTQVRSACFRRTATHRRRRHCTPTPSTLLIYER